MIGFVRSHFRLVTLPESRWLIAGLIALLASACTDPSQQEARSDARVDSLFAHFTTEGSPGASVMVIRDGEILHAAGYGLADLESGALLTPDTPVRLASVSKAFMTMGIMILAERDSLEYDDPVTNWIPELHRFPGITVRHLMNHTSGLPDYWEDDLLESLNPQIDDDPLITNPEAALAFETWGEFVFQPGERYEYSNSAYEMIALIIERISGQSAKAFIRDEIFQPLGMSTADVRDRRDYRISESAVGYSRDENGGWVIDDDHWGNGLVGAGGVYASVNDFYHWDQALYTGWIIRLETLEDAFAPTVLNDGSISEYGFGWSLRDRLGYPAIHHGGDWLGFRTHFLRFPDLNLSVIVLSNATANACELAESVASLYLP